MSSRFFRPRSLAAGVLAIAAGTLITLGAAAAPVGASPAKGQKSAFVQVNLVSNQPGVAPLMDTDLVNAWGLAASPGTDQAPGSPLWVSDNGSDKATLYNNGTATTVSKVPLTVDVTGAAPTGQVFNTDTNPNDFVVTDAKGNSGRALFIFDTENGTIDGWNPGVGVAPGATPPSKVTEVARDNGANAVYKGLAIAQASDGHTYLYATNFRSGRVEAYDSTFTPVELPGGLFVDPKLPTGYGPFGIAEINGKLYVT